MKLSIIVARAKNNAIGLNNNLPWRLSDDLKNFKKITMGHPVIMGRKTFESMGKPLPGRTNIIITRQNSFKAAGCTIVHSLDEAIALARVSGNKESFVIGGADIINQALPITDKIYLTEIIAEVEGDTFLQKIDLNDWKILNKQKFAKAEGVNDYNFSIIEYEREN